MPRHSILCERPGIVPEYVVKTGILQAAVFAPGKDTASVCAQDCQSACRISPGFNSNASGMCFDCRHEDHSLSAFHIRHYLVLGWNGSLIPPKPIARHVMLPKWREREWVLRLQSLQIIIF